MYLGSPRPWPPELGDELASVLDGQRTRRGRGPVEAHPDLHAALCDLNSWLNDNRPYQKRHRHAWQSVADDVRRAIETRGNRLQARTPDLTKLVTELGNVSLGGDPAARLRCRELVDGSVDVLATSEGAVAAFDDLVASLESSQATSKLVLFRRSAFRGCLLAARRNPSVEWPRLTGVLRDAAIDVAIARHQLDGDPLDVTLRRGSAGLSWEARLALCRRLLVAQPFDGSHAVWLVYTDARVRWSHWFQHVGPVTFFNGPDLMTLLSDIEEGKDPPSQIELPSELTNKSSAWRLRRSEFPDNHEFFVTARVDLEGTLFTDPILTAIEIADALVGLASFRQGGSTWRRLDGYIHVIDGASAGFSSFNSPDDSVWVDMDYTDSELECLERDMAPGSVVGDTILGEITALASGLKSSPDPSDFLSIVHDVRVTDVLASRGGMADWTELLEGWFATSWARNEISDSIFRTVEQVVGSQELVHLGQIDGLEDIRRRMMTDDPTRPRGVILNRRVAFEALTEIQDSLPEYHLASRHLHTVVARLASVDALEEWVEELVGDYMALIARTRRCRNSLTHGGPFFEDSARTVVPFINEQARRAVGIALWGALNGKSVTKAYSDQKNYADKWREKLRQSPSVLDAIWDAPPTPTT